MISNLECCPIGARLIELGTIRKSGIYVIVDEADYPAMSAIRWGVSRSVSGSIYARHAAHLGKGQRSVSVAMHRLLMGNPVGMIVDHINGNSLDNRKVNLRICNNTENVRNQKVSKNNTTGYKGVMLVKGTVGRWYRSRIFVNRKAINLGYHPTAEQAAHAYNEAAKEYHGAFARLNIIPGDLT